MHPLDGSFLKFNRAKEHLNVIDKMAEGLRHNHPYSICNEIVRSGDGYECIVRLKKSGKLDPAVALLIGDICSNLRASLDHLIWQLWLLKDPLFNRNVYFPICDEEPSFRGKRITSYISGLTSRQRTMIEQSQPYWTKNRALSTLRDINDCDKHRLIQVIGIVPHEFSIDIIINQSDSSIKAPTPQHLPIFVHSITKIEDGTILARAPIKYLPRRTYVDVHSHVFFDYTFQGSKKADGQLLVDSLLSMFDEVHRIISLFESDFASFGTSQYR